MSSLIDVFGLVRFGFRYRVRIAVAGFLGGALVGGWSYHAPRQYTTTLGLIEYSSQKINGAAAAMAGLNSLIGAQLPGTGLTSPNAIAELVSLDEVLAPVAKGRYPRCLAGDVTCGPAPDLTPASLDHWYPDLAALEGEERRWAAVRLLSATLVTATPNRQGGYAMVRVTSASPSLSVSLASAIAESLRSTYARLQTDAAREQRVYSEQRMGEAATELWDAEAALVRFESRNRSFTSAPRLALEHDRLRREVALKSELYSSLRRAVDAARLDELSTGPRLSVLQHAALPVLPDPKGTVFRAVAAAMMAGFLVLAWTWIRAMPRAA